MADLIKSYKEFLNKGKTERECVVQLIDWAEKNGYKNIERVKKISVGDKVYFQKMNKAIALFQFGSSPLENGMNILGAHIDSPRLDVKQNPLYEKDFLVYLNTHYYGGIKKYQWVTLPLAIHGVICTKDGRTIDVKIGEEDDEPVFVISDILPHLAQKQMKELASDFIPGENLDLICGSESPSKENEKENAKKAILKILKDKYGIEEDDFASSELEVIPAGKARDLGLDKSMVLAYGQDDRACAFTSARAMLDSVVKNRTLCCLCVDKEEIGSVGATGMASHFFENAVAEIIERSQDVYSDLCLRRCLANSYMLSSDVNAAYDPMNAELFDKNNSSFLGGGIVFNKYTGSRGKSGASDANPEFIAKLRRVLDENKVKYQMAELGKVDQGGGGTIAYLAAKYGMEVLDAGVSVLSMHSPWEITNKFDLEQAYNAYKAFFTL
ncbi:aminopeptidase [Treponema pectinovorum]|uniref:aminopeptidase n=1 Tax=Treponema pectinovorum TaxID=164 RepID=UPI0011C8E670|nr:aminopeptidase [Treponema pectinovorum]